MSTTVADPPQRGFFGHPRGLSTLFFTEMWERFSYYGMRAILALYLASEASRGGLGLSEQTATSIVAGYGACVYLTAILGGWLADRVLGSRRSILYGGVIIMFGHIFMALPGGAVTVFVGSVLIILGSGFLKPNISKVVGSLYSDTDTRRDAGFSLFYMGINVGSLLGQMITGYLGEVIDWHLGFGAAAVGMAIGVTQYVLGRRNLGDVGTQPENPLPAEHKAPILWRLVGIALGFVVILGGAAVFGFIGIGGLVNLITIIASVLPIVYFVVMLRSSQITAIERSRLLSFIPLFLGTALFFLLFEQQATTLVFLAENQTSTQVLGVSFPVSWFQSVNPAAIIVLAPLFATLWIKLGTRQPGTPMKFVGGLFFVGAAFLWILLSGHVLDSSGKISAVMLAMVFVIMTVGELMLSPTGMSATTKLAPAAFASQTMGLYWLAPALGQGLGAQVVKLYSEQNQDLYFGVIGLATIGCAVLLAVSSGRIRQAMHGVL